MVELSKNDRCDRCNAQAFVVVSIYNSLLYFCGHHFKKHEKALVEQGGEVVVNNIEGINSKPMAGVGAV